MHRRLASEWAMSSPGPLDAALLSFRSTNYMDTLNRYASWREGYEKGA